MCQLCMNEKKKKVWEDPMIWGIKTHNLTAIDTPHFRMMHCHSKGNVLSMNSITTATQ